MVCFDPFHRTLIAQANERARQELDCLLMESHGNLVEVDCLQKLLGRDIFRPPSVILPLLDTRTKMQSLTALDTVTACKKALT